MIKQEEMVWECGGRGNLRFSKVDRVGTVFCDEMTVVQFLGRDDGSMVGVGSATEGCAIS